MPDSAHQARCSCGALIWAASGKQRHFVSRNFGIESHFDGPTYEPCDKPFLNKRMDGRDEMDNCNLPREHAGECAWDSIPASAAAQWNRARGRELETELRRESQ